MDTAATQIAVVTRDGFELRGRIQNVPSDEAAPTVILSYGLTSSLEQEKALACPDWETLSDYTAGCFMHYDPVGHGTSAIPHRIERYTWRALGEDLRDVIDRTYDGKGPLFVGGTSMSAAASLWLATSEVDKPTLHGLILILPPTAWEARAQKAPEYKKLGTIAETEGMERVMEILQRTPHTPFTEREYPEARAIAFSFLRAFSSTTYSMLLKGAALSDLPPRELVRQCKIPTLILAREDDPTHPVDVANELESLLPQATLLVAKTKNDMERWPEAVAHWMRKQL